MDPEVHEYLVDVYGADGLPFNTRFGNGDPIGEDVVELLNEVYEANTAARALAGRRPDARRQHPHRAQPGGLSGATRGAGGHGRRRAADRRLAAPVAPRAAIAAGRCRPSFAVIPGAQVQRVLQGREKQIVDLVEATYRCTARATR